jgi:hypothetical protein
MGRYNLSGSAISASRGKPATSSRTRASYRERLTAPTFKPKLPQRPAQIGLHVQQLAAGQQHRCSWATSVFTCTGLNGRKGGPIDARKGVGWQRRFFSRSVALLGRCGPIASAQRRTHAVGALPHGAVRYDDGGSKCPASCVPLWAKGWVQRGRRGKHVRKPQCLAEVCGRRTGPRPLFTLHRTLRPPVLFNPSAPPVAPGAVALRRESPMRLVQLAVVDRRLPRHRLGCLRTFGHRHRLPPHGIGIGDSEITLACILRAITRAGYPSRLPSVATEVGPAGSIEGAP